MALTIPNTVTLERPTGASFGKTMNEIRSWLDSKKIEPTYFTPVTRHNGIGFEISFRNSDEAKLFEREFVY
jgi:hypothetical protein